MVLSMSATSSPLRRPRDRVSSTSTACGARWARIAARSGPSGEGAGQAMSAASPGDSSTAAWPATSSRAASITGAVRVAASRLATSVRV